MLAVSAEGSVKVYSKDQFMKDLVNDHEKDIRGYFEAGARRMLINFT